jgi:hypothetical protein
MVYLRKIFSTLAVLLTCLSLRSYCQPPLDSNGTLVGIIQVFRHGVREAIYPLWDATNFTVDGGELRNPGMRQHFLLGDQYRKRYIEDAGFISAEYNKSEFHVVSTDYNRTLMSAGSHLYGLFPVGSGPNLPKNYPKEKAVPPTRFPLRNYEGNNKK